MSYYANPTANAAMGAVDKEIRAKKKLAKRLKVLRKQGFLSEAQIAAYRHEFRGIHRKLYADIFRDEENPPAGNPAGGDFLSKIMLHGVVQNLPDLAGFPEDVVAAHDA